MQIVWSVESEREVAEIVEYIAEFDALAARRLRHRFETAVIPLSDHHYMGRPGRVSGTREFVLNANYVIVYSVTDHIRIESVMHSRQEYP